MLAKFNWLGLFTPRSRTQIDLREELDARLLRIEDAQRLRRCLENAERMSAHSSGSLGLCIRLDAAAAAKIRTLLDNGRTMLAIEDGQTVDQALLGRYATQFRIYERNVEEDMRLAFGN